MNDKAEVKALFANGHFYSPVVDPEEAKRHAARIWPPAKELVGLEFDAEEHRRLLTDVFPALTAEFDYPRTADEAVDRDGRQRFYLDNDQFTSIDARLLFALLRHRRPARVVEVGSGFSSLLMADVNRRYLGSSAMIQCIEPFPREFLRDAASGHELIERGVEQVPYAFFESLRAGDFLFVDSSHVSKTGSDVNYLILEIFPRLAEGVIVHVHDVFLPNDYPYKWVVSDNRSWNEQYILQAYLTFNARARILFGASFAYNAFPTETLSALGPDATYLGPGSLWFQVM